MTKFDEIYQDMIRKIMTEGYEEVNQSKRAGGERSTYITKAVAGMHF